MRKYWMKIALGALAVFALGMLVVRGIASGRTKVERIMDGTDAVTIPFAFVPFRLDGNRVGTIDKVKLIRDGEDIDGAVLTVDLAEGTSPEVLDRCILLVDGVEHMDERTTFRCVQPADTAGLSLVPLVRIELRQRPGELVALARESEVHSLGQRDGARRSRVQVRVTGPDGQVIVNTDSIEAYAESIAVHAESVATAAAARAGRVHVEVNRR